MAQLLGSLAQSYLTSKIGGSLTGGGEGGGITQEGIGNSLGNLAAGSSGDTLSPHKFSLPGGGIQYYNRRDVDARKKKRMF